MKKTYEQWMAEVDREINKRVGLSSHDLSDVCYYDWYENDVTPARAAARAIKNCLEY